MNKLCHTEKIYLLVPPFMFRFEKDWSQEMLFFRRIQNLLAKDFSLAQVRSNSLLCISVERHKTNRQPRVTAEAPVQTNGKIRKLMYILIIFFFYKNIGYWLYLPIIPIIWLLSMQTTVVLMNEIPAHANTQCKRKSHAFMLSLQARHNTDSYLLTLLTYSWLTSWQPRQTVWTLIRTDILSILFLMQTVLTNTFDWSETPKRLIRMCG